MNASDIKALFPEFEVNVQPVFIIVYEVVDGQKVEVGSVYKGEGTRNNTIVNAQMGSSIHRFAEVQTYKSRSTVRNKIFKSTSLAGCVPGGTLNQTIDHLIEESVQKDFETAIKMLAEFFAGEGMSGYYNCMTVRARNFFEMKDPDLTPWSDEDEKILEMVLAELNNITERLTLINKARAAGLSIQSVNKQ